VEGNTVDDHGFSLDDGATAQFWRDGYIVIPAVFSVAMIDKAKTTLLRDASLENRLDAAAPRLGSHAFPKQAAAYSAARELIFSDAVISIVRQLLGHRPIYFGDSSVNYGPGYTGWHKDNRVSDRKDGAAPDWQGDYDLIRVGIYLQDCTSYSGGLLVRAGSHNNAPHLPGWARNGQGPLQAAARRGNAFRSRFYGQARFVDTRKGDIVVWTLRTTHAGHAVRIKGMPKLLLDPRVQQIIPKFLRVPTDGTRAAVFATFARPGSHYDRYREYLLSREYFASRPQDSITDFIPSTVTVDEIRRP
jgi:hypothetical protein